MATITQLASNAYEAHFNRQHWRILFNSGTPQIYRLTQDIPQPVANDTQEARSLLRFVGWHRQSKQASSELPTLFALADNPPVSD